jgi:hypothetical protein
MASRKILMEAFFSSFIAFATELKDMFPEDPDFGIFENALKLLQKTNPSLAVTYYKQNVLNTKFNEKIAQKDESFFLNYSYDEFHEEVGGADVIGKLKQYWTVITPTSRELVWDYIITLDRLARHLVKTD